MQEVGPGCRSAIWFPVFIVLVLIGSGFAMFVWPGFFGSLAGNAPNGANPGPGRPVPAVSDRFLASGTSTATVTGGFAFSGSLEIDPIASYAQDGLVWLSFHNATRNEVLVVFNEPEDSVTVSNGTLTAIGRDDACAFNVEVTPSLIAGSISCPAADVVRDGEAAGTASIQLRFSAVTDTSEP